MPPGNPRPCAVGEKADTPPPKLKCHCFAICQLPMTKAFLHFIIPLKEWALRPIVTGFHRCLSKLEALSWSVSSLLPHTRVQLPAFSRPVKRNKNRPKMITIQKIAEVISLIFFSRRSVSRLKASNSLPPVLMSEGILR